MNVSGFRSNRDRGHLSGRLGATKVWRFFTSSSDGIKLAAVVGIGTLPSPPLPPSSESDSGIFDLSIITYPMVVGGGVGVVTVVTTRNLILLTGEHTRKDVAFIHST